jgi:2-oxoglutarate ferredoxin oxidoreductase subunit alpha
MAVEQRDIVRFELLMDAGFGAQKAGDILIQAFAKSGKFVYIEPMIPAEISPPPRTAAALSGVIIRVADFDITNIGNDTDLIVASNEIVLNRRLDDQETNINCRVMLDMGDKADNPESYEKVCRRLTQLGLNLFPFEVDPNAKTIIKSMGGKGQNMYYLGMLAAIYNMTVDVVTEEIRKSFGKKLKEDILNQNLQLLSYGYRYAKENVMFSYDVKGTRKASDVVLIDGNTSLAMGIIDAGIKFYSGYPITPASSIMHTLAKEFPSYGGLVHQAEDEIAAIGAAIGSYYSGVPAVTGTSGPGLSLKQEFIGYASAAEIPIIIIDAQRSGPSTGMPTKTEQSDLLTAIFGSHGDYTKIVLSVANVIDCFYAPQMARYLAEKLRLPVFIMSDFMTANSYKVIDTPKANAVENVDDIPDFVFERFHIQRLPKELPMVRINQQVPGTPNGMRRVTGLNTNAEGSVSYSAGSNQRSHEVRNAKVHAVKKALTKPEMFGKEKNDLLIVGWGSSRGAIEEAIINKCEKQGVPASGMHLKVVHPLPMMLKDIFQNFKKVVTVELAYGDQIKHSPLALLLRAETTMDIRAMINYATGRPLRPNTIVEEAKKTIAQIGR